MNPVKSDFETSSRAGEDALDIFMIAELPDGLIRSLTVKELARIILASGLPLSRDFNPERLRYRDRETLVRLAMHARRICQHRAKLISELD